MVVRREEIFNATDLDACDRLIADEYVEHALATFGRSEPGRVPGPATMRQTAQFIIGQFPDVSMTVESIIAEGDEVALRVTARGTNLGSIGGRRAADGAGVRCCSESLVPC